MANNETILAKQFYLSTYLGANGGGKAVFSLSTCLSYLSVPLCISTQVSCDSLTYSKGYTYTLPLTNMDWTPVCRGKSSSQGSVSPCFHFQDFHVSQSLYCIQLWCIPPASSVNRPRAGGGHHDIGAPTVRATVRVCWFWASRGWSVRVAETLKPENNVKHATILGKWWPYGKSYYQHAGRRWSIKRTEWPHHLAATVSGWRGPPAA